MSTRGKRIVTYKRDPERQKRQRKKKALGVSTWDDVARLAATPAISLRDRPSLQVAQFTWTQNKVPVVFNPGGTVYLMTMYPFGGSEAQRHANTTMTYKMSIGQEVQLDKAFYASCGMYYMQWWLVYDKASTGTLPATSTIFDTFYQNFPNTWTVARDVCHRFIVKRKWKTILTSNGVDISKPGQICAPAKQRVGVNKFFKKLGVKTEWKNSSTGDIGDIKSGALYLIGAPSHGVVCNVYGRFRVYFKSVGNQ
uniref:Capsid protein n=1 Tax=Sweet potato symptomless virus 1 TaxID=603333 RepID=A0A2S0X0A7_9GEMI|nr:coat protein [Sweet potato symptomless virus 1]